MTAEALTLRVLMMVAAYGVDAWQDELLAQHNTAERIWN